MKKLFFYMTMAAVVVSTGCNSFLEGYNTSPNSPSEMTPGLLLSNAEVGLFAIYGGQIARMTSMWTQQLEGVNDQMLKYGTRYDFLEGDVTNEWDLIYTETIDAAADLVATHGGANSHYGAIGKICEAMAFGVATDLWGDIPMSEAIQGADNLNPKFDAQEDVINAIQKLLDEAITALNAPATGTAPQDDDIIFGGDAAAWVATAYTLKARYAMRISERDAGAADAALAAAAMGISSSAGDCNAIFGAAGNEQNTWAAFDISRPQYIGMAEGFVNAMILTNDPRLPFYAGVDTGGVYRGAAPGSGDQTVSPVGSYLKSSTIPMVSYVENLFIMAEAHLAKGAGVDAADAYNDAVKASILAVTGASDPVYEGLFANETSSTITKDKIMLSKYAAMFGHPEAYNDWRRTGIPALTPQPDGVMTPNIIPLRFPFPLEERLYNTSAPDKDNIPLKDEPVWWDNN